MSEEFKKAAEMVKAEAEKQKEAGMKKLSEAELETVSGGKNPGEIINKPDGGGTCC